MTLERDIHFVVKELAARRLSGAAANGLLKQLVRLHSSAPWGRLVLFEQWLDVLWRRYERLDLSLHDLAEEISARLPVLISRRRELHGAGENLAVVVPLAVRRIRLSSEMA